MNQSLDDVEIIVVDDGSQDDTKEVLLPYVQQQQINYIYQSNKGVSAARNAGAAMAIGQYLVFLDSDDKVKSNWLDDYREKIIQQSFDILYCGIERVKANLVVGYTNPMNPYNNGVAYGNFIPGSEVFREIQ